MLPNARQERFAQELAKGKTVVEAYASAGYKRG
jgi:phage terminase small subunit